MPRNCCPTRGVILLWVPSCHARATKAAARGSNDMLRIATPQIKRGACTGGCRQDIVRQASYSIGINAGRCMHKRHPRLTRADARTAGGSSPPVSQHASAWRVSVDVFSLPAGRHIMRWLDPASRSGTVEITCTKAGVLIYSHSCSMRAVLLAAVQVLLVLLPAAQGGGYGRGKPHRLALYNPEQYYWNHVSASRMSLGERYAGSRAPGRLCASSHEAAAGHATTSWLVDCKAQIAHQAKRARQVSASTLLFRCIRQERWSVTQTAPWHDPAACCNAPIMPPHPHCPWVGRQVLKACLSHLPSSSPHFHEPRCLPCCCRALQTACQPASTGAPMMASATAPPPGTSTSRATAAAAGRMVRST